MLRIGLAQINQSVGDIAGNVSRIGDAIEWAKDAGAQVAAFPELAITGYPPEDLVLSRSFIAANEHALLDLAESCHDLITIIGFVDARGSHLYNAAAICHGGEVKAVYHKQLLPNYGVFDEHRYFEPGTEHTLIDTEQGVIGVCVCEDIWFDPGPAISQGDAGAQVIVNINASPFHKGKSQERAEMLGVRARRAQASIAYVNMVGGQDELLFDGGSLVLDASGEVIARWPQHEELLDVVDVPWGSRRQRVADNVHRLSLPLRSPSGTPAPAPMAQGLSPEAEIYGALELGLRDYATKNDFKNVVIGLSGGIDSALTTTIAVDALGPLNVLTVAMPSEFSSDHSIQDAKVLAANLDVEMLEVPIASTYNAYLRALDDAFGHGGSELAEENLQARIRGNLLMFISNSYGHLVLATGNKSEMACGYSTLYGDMAGGFSLLKDVFKTEVYALGRYRNSLEPVIPERILTKPPSAELRPGQKDSDTLPAYDVLDPILTAYIERNLSIAEMAEEGHDPEIVEHVVALVDRAEYKRRQAPPGPKVTTKSFGRDRRLPITNRWRADGGSRAEGEGSRGAGEGSRAGSEGSRGAGESTPHRASPGEPS